MGDQEIDVLQKLHLSTACDHCHHHPAAACGHSAKRSRSPLSITSTLRPPSSPFTAAANQDFRGFNRLPLPEYFTAASPPPLRRTLSEPIPVFEQQAAPATAGTPPRPPARRNSSRSPSYEENPSSAAANQDFRGFNKIPLPEYFTAASPPPLRRSLSEPIPVFDQQAAPATAATPPRPPARRNSSRSPSYEENPSSKKLKRMKERMREMSQWWNEFSSEDDDQYFDSRNFNDTKEECDEHVDNPSQEAVFVEKSGESLVLHFKCPCGDGYQILLSGNNCYYKLTNFRNC